jgi:hypothetical protein
MEFTVFISWQFLFIVSLDTQCPKTGIELYVEIHLYLCLDSQYNCIPVHMNHKQELRDCYFGETQTTHPSKRCHNLQQSALIEIPKVSSVFAKDPWSRFYGQSVNLNLI